MAYTNETEHKYKTNLVHFKIEPFYFAYIQNPVELNGINFKITKLCKYLPSISLDPTKNQSFD